MLIHIEIESHNRLLEGRLRINKYIGTWRLRRTAIPLQSNNHQDFLQDGPELLTFWSNLNDLYLLLATKSGIKSNNQ